MFLHMHPQEPALPIFTSIVSATYWQRPFMIWSSSATILLLPLFLHLRLQFPEPSGYYALLTFARTYYLYSGWVPFWKPLFISCDLNQISHHEVSPYLHPARSKAKLFTATGSALCLAHTFLIDFPILHLSIDPSACKNNCHEPNAATNAGNTTVRKTWGSLNPVELTSHCIVGLHVPGEGKKRHLHLLFSFLYLISTRHGIGI